MVQLREIQAKEACLWAWQRMNRTKTLPSDIMETPLKRCLTTVDITLLGIGHMIGAGIYVLSGTVAKNLAGPSIIISFLLVGFASLLAALCYAEFGARVPKAGSAYVYTYVTIGEFWAFVIGWNIVLEHMIGAASVARAWSGYIDSLFDGSISNSTIHIFGEMHQKYLAPYPDPLAFCVTIIYCGLLTMGVKGSSYINSVFTLVNICVVIFIISVGIFFADIGNWQTEGGFAPFGLSGIIAGAATSFYAFVGFDSIATAGEEAINPSKSIPTATIIAMSVVTVGYVLIGAVVTLIVPYYSLNPAAALPDAFASIGLDWAKYVISIGALCGMTTTLFGGLFALPRCLYAMASDGLLFGFFAKVSENTQVPILNMLISGFCTALLALLFDIEKLVEFMSIGTLMAFTIVSAAVIILRYQDEALNPLAESSTSLKTTEKELQPTSDVLDEKTTLTDSESMLRPSFLWLSRWFPASGSRVVSWAVIAFTVASAALCSLMSWDSDEILNNPALWIIFVIIPDLVTLILSLGVILIYRQRETKLSFAVPLVPFLPLLSIFLNVALMVHLNPMTWVRFGIWMTFGLILYFSYGLYHSKENAPVSSYSNLLTEPTPAKETVFGDVHQKLSQVTSKIMAAAIESSAKSGKKEEQILDEKEVY